MRVGIIQCNYPRIIAKPYAGPQMRRECIGPTATTTRRVFRPQLIILSENKHIFNAVPKRDISTGMPLSSRSAIESPQNPTPAM